MGDDGTGLLSGGEWRPFRRSGEALYEVSLGPDDRAMLRALPEQLRTAMSLNPEDESFRRLHPPAYADDYEAEKEYRQLVGTELDRGRDEALETLSTTADAAELSQAQLEGWARALNDIRLWLGTVLDVSDEMEDDELDDPGYRLYQGLTYLQGAVIDALMEN